MTVSFKHVFAVMSMIMASAIVVLQVQADPLVGRDLLKFSQLPMVATPIPGPNGTVNTYQGHDELSTIYGFTTNPGVRPQEYRGKFMADDFADNLTSPVVHVKWWGSYRNDIITPQMPVNRFLIAFETDVPANPSKSFSTPGQVLKFDVVDRVPSLGGPGLGQFTEKLIRGPDPIFGESLYEYNAELHTNGFFEQKDTVYWLKIAAMVDAPPGLTFQPFAPPSGVTQWGWHNRDYTIQDTLASPVPVPGEFVDGSINGVKIWHFQDDAVQGDMLYQPFSPTLVIRQNNMSPQRYVDFADGPGLSATGIPGISSHSKDLAFQLFTIVPEPATCALLACSLLGLAMTGRRRGKQRLALS